MCMQAEATAAAACDRLARHQLAVPAQNGVRRHDRRNLREQAPTQAVTQFGQAPPLVVFEPQALPRQPILQEAILLTKERDQIGLLTVQPATEGRDQTTETVARAESTLLPSIDRWDTMGLSRARTNTPRGIGARFVYISERIRFFAALCRAARRTSMSF